MSKYGAIKTTVNGIVFDSKREAARYGELLLLQRAGTIQGLRLQVSYELAPSVKLAGSKRAKPALRYLADFSYVENGAQVVEDVKGVVTSLFRAKQHLMKSIHNIDIRITK